MERIRSRMGQKVFVMMTAAMILGLICAGTVLAMDEVDWRPTSISGLQLWLSADWGVTTADDGVTVMRWEDRSGQGNNAVAGEDREPTLVEKDGHFGLLFDRPVGDPSFLTIPHDDGLNAGEGFSVFVVYTNHDGNRIMQKRRGASNGVNAWFVYATGGLSVAGQYSRENIFPPDPNRIYLQSNVFDAGSVRIDVFRDGELVSAVLGVPAQEPNEDNLTIGKREQSNPAGFKGIIYEILIYNKAVTEDEQSQIEQYLMGKYGL